MKNWKMKAAAVLFVAALAVWGTACKKDDDNTQEPSRMNVHLTDAPGNFQAVYVDIQALEIHASDNDNGGGWQSLPLINPGVYNLLDFTNGLDTLLSSAELPAGRVSQLRLVLGSNNSVTVDSVNYPLTTPSGQTSGLKLQINADLKPGVTYDLWIDFDAARSIVYTGSGTYILKPVIRTYTAATSGAIEGHVTPTATMPYVMAVAGTDTMGTLADTAGYFLIKGVPAGTYNVTFKPTNGYSEKTVSGVGVTTGQTTDMGTVTLVP